MKFAPEFSTEVDFFSTEALHNCSLSNFMTDIGLSTAFPLFKIDRIIDEIIKSLLLLILGMLGHALYGH